MLKLGGQRWVLLEYDLEILVQIGLHRIFGLEM